MNENEHKCNKDCACEGEKTCTGCSEHSGKKKEEFHGLKVYPGMKIKWKGKKVLPNDRCPCGSGRKFKKCCGR